MLIITRNIICKATPISLTMRQNEIINTKKLKEIIIVSLLDSVIIGGIVFFSTLASMGVSDIGENIRISLISSVVSSGLSFFTEIRRKRSKLILK